MQKETVKSVRIGEFMELIMKDDKVYIREYDPYTAVYIVAEGEENEGLYIFHKETAYETAHYRLHIEIPKTEIEIYFI